MCQGRAHNTITFLKGKRQSKPVTGTLTHEMSGVLHSSAFNGSSPRRSVDRNAGRKSMSVLHYCDIKACSMGCRSPDAASGGQIM
ncbi:hypothetical protein VTK56DRAFT_6500 [Thermocarpiscus australiensis]